ncbi:MAG: AF1514 family protein [Pseudomonadota bacterium]
MQIPSISNDTSVETISLTIPDPDLDFSQARDRAREAALEHCQIPPMMLAWNDARAGRFYPTFECNRTGQPPWIVYARARGANLTVDINQGGYVFLFLKL